MALLEQPAQAERPGDRLPLPCMHCDNPPCVKVCPVNATYQTDEGIVAQIWDRCIGCRYCEVACPYGRRYFNFVEPEWPESYTNYLNPDVATRPLGVVEKCTFCTHRVRRGQGGGASRGSRTLEDSDVQRLPACAAGLSRRGHRVRQSRRRDERGGAPVGEPARLPAARAPRHAAQGDVPVAGPALMSASTAQVSRIDELGRRSLLASLAALGLRAAARDRVGRARLLPRAVARARRLRPAQPSARAAPSGGSTSSSTSTSSA